MSDEPFLTAEDVAEIVAILDGTGYDRFEVQTRRVSVRLARSGGGWNQDWRHLPSDGAAETVEPAAAEVDGARDIDGLVSVRSPLPGTFYRAPQPGAADFVAVGDAITAATIIGIIETMKVMNSIPAGVDGEVVEVIARSGAMVDPADILMRVRATSR